MLIEGIFGEYFSSPSLNFLITSSSADSSNTLNRVYHAVTTGLVVLAPVSLYCSPSIVTYPIDFILGVAFPLHAHVGLNYVISDYVPKASRVYARAGLLGLTVVTIAGLFKLNYEGPGLTESFKALWKLPKKKE